MTISRFPQSLDMAQLFLATGSGQVNDGKKLEFGEACRVWLINEAGHLVPLPWCGLRAPHMHAHVAWHTSG